MPSTLYHCILLLTQWKTRGDRLICRFAPVIEQLLNKKAFSANKEINQVPSCYLAKWKIFYNLFYPGDHSPQTVRKRIEKEILTNWKKGSVKRESVCVQFIRLSLWLRRGFSQLEKCTYFSGSAMIASYNGFSLHV